MYGLVVIPCWFGQINVKLDSNSLFSERYGKAPTLSIFGLRFTWRKWR